jgi:tRNA U54 and U55 pseudouridine synthase Pus10
VILTSDGKDGQRVSEADHRAVDGQRVSEADHRAVENQLMTQKACMCTPQRCTHKKTDEERTREVNDLNRRHRNNDSDTGCVVSSTHVTASDSNP